MKQRRMRLRVGKKALAEMAGVSRDTLHAIEGGQGFRQDSLHKIQAALDDLEEEVGGGDVPSVHASPVGPPESGLVRFEVPIPGRRDKASVIVQGPVTDMPALVAAVQRLLAEQDPGAANEGD